MSDGIENIEDLAPDASEPGDPTPEDILPLVTTDPGHVVPDNVDKEHSDEQ